VTTAGYPLFGPNDLDPETGLFVVRGAGRRPQSVTMTGDDVADYLGISARDVTTSSTRRQIRRVGKDKYATSTVTPHRRATEVCSTDQMLAVLCRSAGWWRENRDRLTIRNWPVGTVNRYSRADVNKVAANLRRLDNHRTAVRIASDRRRRGSS
jgi:hypothetical protein